MSVSLRSFLSLVVSVAAMACAAPSDVGIATEALSDHAVATRVGDQVVVLEDRLRHDVDGAPVMLFEVQEIGGASYLVRALDRGERHTQNYVALRQEGNDYIVDAGSLMKDCGWCHEDDGNCRACYYATTGNTGLQVCSCDAASGDGVEACSSVTDGVVGLEDIFMPDYI